MFFNDGTVPLQSLEGIIKASKEELVLCPGLGPQKVCRDTLISYFELLALYVMLHRTLTQTIFFFFLNNCI